MKEPRDTLIAVCIATIVTLALVSFWYHDAIVDPSLFLGKGGDAYKNYFTLQYHVLHDSAYWHFEGMNYPYGEHVVFTDNQPVLANMLRFIHEHLFSLSGKLVPTLNLLIFLGIVICAIVLALIFREFGVNAVYAGIAAAGIAMLSPQLLRLGGHYALSYCFMLPLIWYWWIKYYKTQRLLYSLLIAGAMLFFAFIHLYYLALGLFFGCALWFFYYIFHKLPVKRFTHFFIQFILPFLLAQVWIALTDTVGDRTDQPFGFLHYRARWESVFLPVQLALGEYISNNIASIRPIYYEARAYAGLAVTLFYLIWLFRLLPQLINKKSASPFHDLQGLNISFWAGLTLLLFSLGIPFVFGLQGLVEYLGPLKQFRSLGRFAWVFYYTANITAFVWFYKQHINSRSKVLKYLLLAPPFMFLATDVYMINSDVSSHVPSNEHFSNDKLPLDPGDYQAIIPLPFYHVGSEVESMDIRCNIGLPSMEAAVNTGLPLMAANLSRTSVSQATSIIDFIKGINNNYSRQLPSHEPFLIIAEDDCPLEEYENNLKDQAEYLFSRGSFSYYKLSLPAAAQ